VSSTRYSCQIVINISDTFSKNINTSNFVKTRSVWAQLFCADTDTTKIIAAFRSFATAPKNVLNAHSHSKRVSKVGLDYESLHLTAHSHTKCQIYNLILQVISLSHTGDLQHSNTICMQKIHTHFNFCMRRKYEQILLGSGKSLPPLPRKILPPYSVQPSMCWFQISTHKTLLARIRLNHVATSHLNTKTMQLEWAIGTLQFKRWTWVRTSVWYC